MALEDVAQMACSVDGQFLVNIAGITAKLESGQVPVMTLQGLMGFMSTGGVRRITLTYHKPANGSEFNFDKACAEGGLHTIEVYDGAETYVGEGKFMTTDRSQNTGEAGTCSVDFEGEPNAFE